MYQHRFIDRFGPFIYKTIKGDIKKLQIQSPHAHFYYAPGHAMK